MGEAIKLVTVPVGLSTLRMGAPGSANQFARAGVEAASSGACSPLAGLRVLTEFLASVHLVTKWGLISVGYPTCQR